MKKSRWGYLPFHLAVACIAVLGMASQIYDEVRTVFRRARDYAYDMYAVCRDTFKSLPFGGNPSQFTLFILGYANKVKTVLRRIGGGSSDSLRTASGRGGWRLFPST